MHNLEDIKKAFFLWNYEQPFRQTDLMALPYLKIENQIPKGGWLRSNRKALQMSQAQMAKRLGISQAAYALFEKTELDGAIRIENLRRAAQAMGCELVYSLRSTSGKPLSVLIWEKIFPEALRIYQERTRQTIVRPEILASIAKNLMREVEFRKQMGWVKNSSESDD